MSKREFVRIFTTKTNRFKIGALMETGVCSLTLEKFYESSKFIQMNETNRLNTIMLPVVSH